MTKNTAIISLFATCTMKCGYCDLAESGQVMDKRQLLPFGDKEYVLNLADFFNSRTNQDEKWQLFLTGGEPLLMPNLSLLCNSLFEAGNSVAFYTSLHIGVDTPSWKFLMSTSYPQVEYIMASFHPEAEAWEEEYFRKISALKEKGHKVFFRYVGHPKRLARLDELEARCAKMNINFFPTALLSSIYPNAYTPQEREILSSKFGSLTQFIQIEGGIDTTNVTCHAGSKIIAVDFQSGNITPCITLASPIIGNIHQNYLERNDAPIKCPKPGINCVCDIHFQQNIIIGAEDNNLFENQRMGFTKAIENVNPLRGIKKIGIKFYKNSETGMGINSNPELLIFSKKYVKSNFKKNILKNHLQQTDIINLKKKSTVFLMLITKLRRLIS